MPIYDYLCEKCNKKVELITLDDLEKARRCRKCGEVMKRLPSQANFSLKGHCWATDNYGSARDE